MLTVTDLSKSQLNQIEYLIEQSLQGHHFLFDPKQIREAMETASAVTTADTTSEMTKHLELLIRLPSMRAKLAYVERMDQSSREALVTTYFSIVGNHLANSEKGQVRH